MAVNSVTFSQAMRSASCAQQYLRTGNISESERAQLVVKWGAENVQKWMTVDSTEYVIEDDAKANAKEAGKNAAAESTGYDGSKNHGAWIDVAGGAVSAGAAALMGTVGSKLLKETGTNFAAKVATGKLGTKAANKAWNQGINAGKDMGSKAQRNVGAWVAATLAAAEATRYLAAKPNKEQHDAIMHIQSNELPQGNNSLMEAQYNMEEATEEVASLSEEAEEKNDEANEQMEEDKMLFDFYRKEYLALKEKAESGTPLSEDEKALMEQLAPLMEELGADIEAVQEDTEDGVTDLYDEMAARQSVYDESAETISEVQGMTDYAEGFDESTRVMTYVEAAGQGLNATSAGIAVGQLVATNIFGINTPFILMGTYAAAVSGKGVIEQLQMAKNITGEIHDRRDVQDNVATSFENYEAELDNFAGYNEFVEDLEMEVPEDLEVPEPPAVTQPVPGQEGQNGQNADPFVAAMSGEDTQNSPLLAGGNTGANGQNNVPGAQNPPQNNAPAKNRAKQGQNSQGNNAQYSPLTAGNGNVQGNSGNNNQVDADDNKNGVKNDEDEKDPNKKKGKVDK